MAGRKSTATMELAIGATIIAAIIILIVMLMAWGDTASILKRHYRVVVNMSNVGGLKEGAPVKLGGFQIGRVASIQIKPGSTDLEIVLDIDESQLLPRGSTAKVSTAGLVGDAFMEIIPGKSKETIRQATTVADAERLESSPLPDLGEMFTKVNTFGNELISLTQNLNDIVGNADFRRNMKELAVNLNNVSNQANLILQRGQNVVGNVETATQNIVGLTATAKESLEKVTANIEKVAASAQKISEDAKGVIENLDKGIAEARQSLETLTATTKKAIENIDGGVTDARGTIKDISASAKKTIETLDGSLANVQKNVQEVSTTAKKALENIDGAVSEIRTALGNTVGKPEVAANIDSAIRNISDAAGRTRDIFNGIDPAVLQSTMGTLNQAITTASGAVNSLTEVVEKIKADPVLALSANKAADRIVKQKFDEMARLPQFKSADAQLEEIRRWVNEGMNRGHFVDPSYTYEQRPYVMNR